MAFIGQTVTHACFPARAALFIPESGACAQIAFLGMIFLKIPDWPAWREGTCRNACFAADAFSCVHGSDIPMPSINMQRFNRAYGDAGRLHALSALGYVYISGESLKRVLNNLILASDKLSKPSCTREQASMQVRQPWHFFVSTRRYPFEAGTGLRVVQPPNPTPITIMPDALRKFPARKCHARLVDNVFIGFVTHS